ncbi:MAG: YMGG-like glycine zipper-containing protein [Caulobacterales bacterium]
MIRVHKYMMSAAIASMLALSACGTSTTDRAASGALIGAAGGAAIGSASGNTGKGAIIGGAAGAAAGAATNERDVNLGKPVWRDKCVEYYRDGKCAKYE